MLRRLGWPLSLAIVGAVLFVGGSWWHGYDYVSCLTKVTRGFRPIAQERDARFLGKVEDDALACRGDARALSGRDVPWVDWARYWSTGDASSKAGEWLGLVGVLQHYFKNGIGELGALIDLEYQRMELVKFNLHDPLTWRTYVTGADGKPGPVVERWPELRLPSTDPGFIHLQIGRDGHQRCSGPLIRARTSNGICNDLDNPAMGSAGQPFTRNVQFEETFPDLARTDLTRDRHDGRIGLLTPDPQVISRRLFTRQPGDGPNTCNDGRGLPGLDPNADCPYRKAPFFNTLAAFWIQFMTHDWFSHMDEARNSLEMMPTGCLTQKAQGVTEPLSPDAQAKLGCRAGDRVERTLIHSEDEPKTFQHGNRRFNERPMRLTRNFNTAWWDASQIYGYDQRSERRLRRDPKDPAKILMVTVPSRSGSGDMQGYLPTLLPCAAGEKESCLLRPEWTGQEAAAFPDNWTVGLSFLHTVFAREHNLFVEAFRELQRGTPKGDSGLRSPERPDEAIAYEAVAAEELFQVARLVVSAMIAKIHTTEWTPQLLYDRPLDVAMDSNWNGVFGDSPIVKGALSHVVDRLNQSDRISARTTLYSVFSSGPGIIGIGSQKPGWSIANLDHVNGGVNHFGSPFNFPEEFTAVYRLHALVPDLLELRRNGPSKNNIVAKVPVTETRHAKATEAMRAHGLADWGLTLGRQRLGLLLLENAPRFLQNLELPGRLDTTPTRKVDVIALDILRDRERGVPRFNEFRRQYGLKSLTSFNDFIGRGLLEKERRGTLTAEETRELAHQKQLVEKLREVYGRHTCDATKIISRAQKITVDGQTGHVTDCLGKRHGDTVDNIEDLDLYVGWHAETTRPHGFAISETQFQVFILNASRRLYSDRFFTSSFRPEFYSSLGLRWVKENGRDGVVWEAGKPNGERRQVAPLKRVLLRTVPELADELGPVVNTFDPWARARGEYYSLDWVPRPDAKDDVAFAPGR